ncbi:MAG: DUF4234 domain-containing protein [Thermoleophilia bacterium]
MAETLVVRGVTLKKRHPWGVWALSLITFGIYGFVYWHKINTELRDYSAAIGRPFGNDPSKAVLALIPGFLLVVPPYFTAGYTAGRVRRMQDMTVGSETVSPPIAVLLMFLFHLHLVYLQSALNDCWDKASREA